MTTVHAWFSFESALRIGSSVYRKPSGSTVNVTRVSAQPGEAGRYRHTEKYLGQVICDEDGGCVEPLTRVPST